jgi:hypothetical protein
MWVLIFIALTVDGPTVEVVSTSESMAQCFEDRELWKMEVHAMMDKPYSEHFPPNMQAVCIRKDF